ncbi:hypothetical protein CASFOL_006855 [Castilleja foliolosa]|uniref:Uncharacterized protein n=1 Tax=Castilleja foliolosa TaxID=1961234 RepID=A0ABD3E9M0_9LAMI
MEEDLQLLPIPAAFPRVHHFYELGVIPAQYHAILFHTTFVKVVGTVPEEGTVSIRFPTMGSCTTYFSGRSSTLYPPFDGLIRNLTAEVVGERVDDSVFYVRRRDRNFWLNNPGLDALEAEIGAAIPPPPPPPVLPNGFYRIVGRINYQPIANLLAHTALLLVVKAEEKEIGDGRVTLTFPSPRSYARHFMFGDLTGFPAFDNLFEVDTESVVQALSLFDAEGEFDSTWLTDYGIAKVEQIMHGLINGSG